MTFKDHFSVAATGYARYRPTYPAALVDFLVSLTTQHDAAWDVGCGSGQLTALLEGRYTHVYATDPSAQQIAQAMQHPTISYHVASAEASGLTAQSVNLIVAAQAAHWFAIEAFYTEARRVARPGAALALVSYSEASTGEPDLDAQLHHYYSEVVGAYWPPERSPVETGYQTLPFPFAEIAVPPLTIALPWALDNLLGYLDTWSATTRAEKAEGRTAIDAWRAAFAVAWGVPETVRTMTWQLAVRAGRM